MRIFFFIILILFQKLCPEKTDVNHDKKQITVHYIANEGFLLESNGIKILIDGLFNTGLNQYAYPDSSLLSDIIHSKPPFNDIDYLLFTHKHPDHFNDSLACAFMKENPKTTMICPSQGFTELIKYPLYNKKLKNRINAITPDPGKVVIQNFGNLVLKVCRTRHSDTYSIENNAYIMDFGEVNVYHSGDSWKEELNEWKNLDLKAEGIDLAFVNGFYASDGYTLLNEKMNPVEIILIHMKNKHLNMFTELIKKDTAVFHNTTLFKDQLESKNYIF